MGAGPAGSAAAIAARRAGLSVAVVDAAPHGRDKTCGDGLTPRAVHALQELGLDSALPAYRNKGLKLHGYGGSLTAPWPGGFYGTEGSASPRSLFDASLADLAASLGAEMFYECPATGAEFEIGRAHV